MKILVNGREYIASELAREWTLDRNAEGVSVVYRVPKEAAPDVDALRRYVKENGDLF